MECWWIIIIGYIGDAGCARGEGRLAELRHSEVNREIVSCGWYFLVDAEVVLLSSPIFKFNDYKKKQ